MKPPPKGWPRISPSVYYDDAAKAIDWLCKAFGFVVLLKVEGEGGSIKHCELTFGEGLIMIGSTGDASGRADRLYCKSPRALGGANTQGLCLFVDDVDAHCERARAAGARIADGPVTNDYGEDYWCDRSYGAVDIEGHHWWFMQRLREAHRAH